ncbi:MAG: alanine--tRNA ligase [Actinobacteria bacterium]|nr:alanine--tRNA ligase [Actinomycetota bacterium]MBU1942274.1 alanine--tRNA ligase [Actinomycetota bacterium]MBU2687377.1 alanine--tRNA ligase [Actinomycetota bacterium]
MKSADIRRTFIEFFAERDHRVVPSSSLVPNDPTLLLTNAGMVQFKPYFLGEEQPGYTRATSVQKCVRTTDIESVGITARHNTFFEMLGNFSFGDYYKESAIPWAWELVTEVFGIEPASLWMSVYEEDQEAEDIWRSTPGVPPERVIRLGADDNFWDMGATGPCGPCSEILYDRGESLACGPDCRAGCDCDRFLELWNLVFMQYDRRSDQSLVPLPRKNIDTGMGLERLAALKQGVATIFETDIVAPVLQAVSDLCGVGLGEAGPTDVSLKVVADHARAATFLISDGVIPSNEGRGYILRRLLRRAVRHGRLLGIERPFIDGLSDVVVELLGVAYPGLEEHHRLVSGVIRSEEDRFGQTLEQGVNLLGRVIEEARGAGEDTIDGPTVFYLHDTLGFPLEVTREIAADQGMKIDGDGFDRLMSGQRERARASREDEADEFGEVFTGLLRSCGATAFEAYTVCGLDTTVSAIVVRGEPVDQATDEPEVEVVLAATPFYAESGGQVGDTGTIAVPGGSVQVTDTFYGAQGLVVHKGRLTGSASVGEPARADVDEAGRADISRNHSATHLLHWALRLVLGTHAKQAGSLVTRERLRFDFTHFQPVSPEELEEIERLANERVLEDAPVDTDVTGREEAVAGGAIALFGEKYAESVRVVRMGDFSRELCGGIHVERTGRIGPIRIVSENGIGAGLRRIEATSGHETLRHYRRQQELVSRTAVALKVAPEDLPGRVQELAARLKELERASAREAAKSAAGTAASVMETGRTVEVAGVRMLFATVPGDDAGRLRDLADMALTRNELGLVALVAASGDKAQLVVKVDRVVTARLNAKELAAVGGKVLGGGGGGRDDMAVAGGSNLGGLAAALQAVEKSARERLE